MATSDLQEGQGLGVCGMWNNKRSPSDARFSERSISAHPLRPNQRDSGVRGLPYQADEQSRGPQRLLHPVPRCGRVRGPAAEEYLDREDRHRQRDRGTEEADR